MSKKIMLFTLETFKSTGGIQNMTRTMAYSIDSLSREESGIHFQLWSLYDANEDLNSAYIPFNKFHAFAGSKLAFFKRLLQSIKWPDIIIISHINLAVVGLLLKLFNSKCKVWLVAHGIEVWQTLSPIKRTLLKKCDKIVCVSAFTKQEMIRLHHIPESKCVVLNNALDPFFSPPLTFEKPAYLIERYGLNKGGQVSFTLTRINSAEQYKGYDKVIEAMSLLQGEFPNLRYILAGKSDLDEHARIEKLIAKNQLQGKVILTGFINDSELNDHFLLADVFTLPSKGEGFGLVLIEAAACGTPVVCGNYDGSVDAVRNGELGESINVDDIAALTFSISEILRSPLNQQQKSILQEKCLRYFNAKQYNQELNQLICNE